MNTRSMPISDNVLSHVVCCRPLAATGSSLCNPSHTSTGATVWTQTQYCNVYLWVPYDPQMPCRQLPQMPDEQIYAGSPRRGLGVELLLTKIQLSRTPGNGQTLARKRTKTPKKNTSNLHSKQYFPEHRSPGPLCNRRTVLCVKQERELKRGYRPHKTENWIKKLRWGLPIAISNYEPGDRFLRNAVST